MRALPRLLLGEREEKENSMGAHCMHRSPRRRRAANRLRQTGEEREETNRILAARVMNVPSLPPSLRPPSSDDRAREKSWKFIARLWPPAAAAVEVGLRRRGGLDRTAEGEGVRVRRMDSPSNVGGRRSGADNGCVRRSVVVVARCEGKDRAPFLDDEGIIICPVTTSTLQRLSKSMSSKGGFCTCCISFSVLQTVGCTTSAVQLQRARMGVKVKGVKLHRRGDHYNNAFNPIFEVGK